MLYIIYQLIVIDRVQMQCSSHPSQPLTQKCLTCQKYLCPSCPKTHQTSNHNILSSLQLSQQLRHKISEQITKMTTKLLELETVDDYEVGDAVIMGCMEEVVGVVRGVFGVVRDGWRGVVGGGWRLGNLGVLEDVARRRDVFREWLEILHKKPEQAPYFDTHKIYENNKLDSDQQLLDSSCSSYLQSTNSPKLTFNQIALRRANDSLSKIIYTQTKLKLPIPRKHHLPHHRKMGSNTNTAIGMGMGGMGMGGNQEKGYVSLCRFVQDCNVLFQYVVVDGDTDRGRDREGNGEDLGKRLDRIQFREFVVPLRSVCATVGSSVYLIGGYNKDNKPRKEIFYYDRTYTSMRVVGLLKEGRVGHAVCTHEQNIYTFGGKKAKSLQVFNTKTKKSEILVETKHQIYGASMTILSNTLYIIGGTDGIQSPKSLLTFNLTTKTLTELTPTNLPLYPSPISPILLPLTQHELLIFGGYYLFSGHSYNNLYITVLDTRLNNLSVFGKGEVIYPILSHGGSCCLVRDGKILGLVDMKRMRNRHGPNLPVLFFCGLEDQGMEIRTIGL